MILRQHFETYVKEPTRKGLQTFVEQILKKLGNVEKETEDDDRDKVDTQTSIALYPGLYGVT